MSTMIPALLANPDLYVREGLGAVYSGREDLLDRLLIKVGHTEVLSIRQHAYEECDDGQTHLWFFCWYPDRCIVGERLCHLRVLGEGAPRVIEECRGCPVHHREYWRYRDVSPFPRGEERMWSVFASLGEPGLLRYDLQDIEIVVHLFVSWIVILVIEYIDVPILHGWDQEVSSRFYISQLEYTDEFQGERQQATELPEGARDVTVTRADNFLLILTIPELFSNARPILIQELVKFTTGTRTPMTPHDLQLLEAEIRTTPSPADIRRGPGYFYGFEIPCEQPKSPGCRLLARREAKLGRTKDPRKRRRQWARKCRGQRQNRWTCWRVPYAGKFERLLHLHFKLAGAWISPSPCDFCRIHHREKFDYEACGGRQGIEAVVEYYLRRLNWPILR
ncbi:hypothetical protein FB451DRAFT_1193975 [Mycena latifolia]|nr:hypothetical protein FB451DRAFT_1193975 [Mycena latifolia]